MKRLLLIFVISTTLTSCSHENLYQDSFAMMADIELADSLYSIGDTLEASKLLETIITREPRAQEPVSTKDLIISLIFDKPSTEAQYYYNYIFSYLLKLDAIKSLYYNEPNTCDKIEVLKHIFTIGLNIDLVIDNYFEWWESTNKSHALSVYWTYKATYKPLENHSLLSRQDLIREVYRRKWEGLNILLIEHDKMYGYEQTYSFFDSVLHEHGTSYEPDTKALLKSYMSFSGSEKYSYNTQMTYSDFKTIAANKFDYWTVRTIKDEDYKSPFSTSETKHVIDDSNAGIVLKEHNFDFGETEYIYNPSMMPSLSLSFSPYTCYDSLEITTLNEQRLSTILLTPGHSYSISTTQRRIEKPLLLALLYKHNKRDIAHYILQAKEYHLQDTLIREGFRDSYYQRIKQLGSFEEVAWFDENGEPVNNDDGIHCTRKEYIEDSCTIYHHYDKWMQPTKSTDATDVYIDNGPSYHYDWQHLLMAEFNGDIYTFHKYSDSANVHYIVDHLNNRTQVITEYKYKDTLSTISDTRLAKEIKMYDNVYINSSETQYGNLMEIHRLFKDGTYYVGNKGNSVETFSYDNEGRVAQHTYLNNYRQVVEYEKFEYRADSVSISTYDSKDLLIKNATFVHDI